jgi:predicted ATPase
LFDDALVALERGERRRYLVVGEAGIGKSRFLRAASERAAASPVRTLTVSGSSLERGTPFYAWRRTLLGLLGLGDRPSPDAVARRVEAITGMRMGPGAAAIEGLAPSATEVAVEPSAMTGAVHEVLARVFQRLATDAPILLILEVAGQLDSASWSLVDTVYGLDTPVLVLGAIRTPELDEVPAEAMPVVSDAERIRLDALAPDDVTEMIRDIFDVDDVPPRFIDTVLSRAGGHPLFVEEMAMSMRDQGAATVDQRDHSLRIDWELLERMAVPASLHGIIGSRIGRLGATEQMTLKVAGVLGLSFEPGDAAAIHPSPRSVDDDIRHMTSIGLLTAGSDARSASVAFRHGLVAEVAYSLLTGDQRRRLHAAAAEHLTGRPGAEAVLAHHWTEAERPDRAFPALVTAGERALVGSAAHEAAGYFRTALGMVPAASRLQEGAVRRRLGQALDMLGDDPGMRTELLSAAKLFGYPLPGGRLAFGVGIGRQLVRLGWE